MNDCVVKFVLAIICFISLYPINWVFTSVYQTYCMFCSSVNVPVSCNYLSLLAVVISMIVASRGAFWLKDALVLGLLNRKGEA